MTIASHSWITLFLLVSSLSLAAQPDNSRFDLLFLQHLEQQQLFREKLAYLDHSFKAQAIEQDPYFLEKAKTFFQLQLHDSAAANFIRIKQAELYTSETLKQFYTSSWKSGRPETIALSKQLAVTPGHARLKHQHTLLTDFLIHPDRKLADSLPPSLLFTAKQYAKFQAKQPLVGAGLALIPGLGKLYAGRRSFAVQTLLMNALLGLQVYENNKKLGTGHWLTISSITVFSLFYAGNVIGSYYEVKQVKKEKKQLFINETIQYYESTDF
jgi:hypothetical protein